MKDFLESLKPGDVVGVLSGGWHGRPASPAKVAKVTKTQIVVATNSGPPLRFRKRSGHSVTGDTWSRARLVEWTATARRDWRASCDRSLLMQMKWEVLDAPTLTKIAKFVRAAIKEQNADDASEVKP